MMCSEQLSPFGSWKYLLCHQRIGTLGEKGLGTSAFTLPGRTRVYSTMVCFSFCHQSPCSKWPTSLQITSNNQQREQSSYSAAAEPRSCVRSLSQWSHQQLPKDKGLVSIIGFTGTPRLKFKRLSSWTYRPLLNELHLLIYSGSENLLILTQNTLAKYAMSFICLYNIPKYVEKTYILNNKLFMPTDSKAMHIGRVKTQFGAQLILAEMGCFIGGSPMKAMVYVCAQKAFWRTDTPET